MKLLINTNTVTVEKHGAVGDTVCGEDRVGGGGQELKSGKRNRGEDEASEG